MKSGGRLRGAKSINLALIETKMETALGQLCPGREFHVIVTATDNLVTGTDWRIKIPPNETEVYMAMGKIIAKAHEIYETAMTLGLIEPIYFEVSVYVLPPKGAEIVGSCD